MSIILNTSAEPTEFWVTVNYINIHKPGSALSLGMLPSNYKTHYAYRRHNPKTHVQITLITL